MRLAKERDELCEGEELAARREKHEKQVLDSGATGDFGSQVHANHIGSQQGNAKHQTIEYEEPCRTEMIGQFLPKDRIHPVYSSWK